ncbi:Oidioi.mRNA.OKI2018_I69.PAR.g9011.t1.cds [Oikopleura dioica]|uniref:Oidioi.mRNA.OKI2018_I69.PAR.g9011.t1.cds n=1 Tax=Oikopleura dioica TaxID=34765 RepID=A0ABN7RJN7_OIKDI|nr:Oidioi.mRNA.OKI2018_I69.PAR.g9011.t1.cds [Oikopleura dioica]
MKLFSFFAFSASFVEAERCPEEQWMEDQAIACSNGAESGSLCLRFCNGRMERSKVIQCRCYGENNCSWQGPKPDCFKVDQPANLFLPKKTTTKTTTTTSSTTSTSTTTSTTPPRKTTRRTTPQPTTLFEFSTATTALLSKEQRKALKKARKAAERKKARQEAKKFNHFSTVIASAPTVPTVPFFDPEAAPIQQGFVNPLARQNRMNPTNDGRSDYRRNNSDRSNISSNGSPCKATCQQRKTHPAALSRATFGKKKKFEIQKIAEANFRQDSYGFQDYEAEEEPVMFLESETLESFLADTERVLNMTQTTRDACPLQTNSMVECSYDNADGSICVRKDCKNSSVSSCNCINGYCSWSVGEPICQSWGSGCFNGSCESCDKEDWLTDENFICSHLNFHGSKCYRSDCSSTTGFTTIAECECEGNFCEWTKNLPAKTFRALINSRFIL